MARWRGESRHPALGAYAAVLLDFLDADRRRAKHRQPVLHFSVSRLSDYSSNKSSLERACCCCRSNKATSTTQSADNCCCCAETISLLAKADSGDTRCADIRLAKGCARGCRRRGFQKFRKAG